jgi:hypothetical protein
MTTTRHKISATRSGHTNGMDWEAEYTIAFTYLPGSRDYWNKAGGHWEQGWGPEIEYISHEPVSDYGPAAENEVEWCKDWLYENEVECAEIAEQASQPDPDYARDLAIEDRLIKEDWK